MLALALASPFKFYVTLQVLRQSFYVMGKALSDELSCAGTGLVKLLWIFQNWKHLRKIMPIKAVFPKLCRSLFLMIIHSEFQIRKGNKDNSEIILLISD